MLTYISMRFTSSHTFTYNDTQMAAHDYYNIPFTMRRLHGFTLHYITWAAGREEPTPATP